MVKSVFLTEKRRKLLQGDRDDLTEQSTINEKSRVRTRARLAVDELIEVAESDEIENSTVFDPEDVERLLRAILGPEKDIRPFWEVADESTEIRRLYNERYAYERAVVDRLQHLTTIYDARLNRLRSPPDDASVRLFENE